MKPETQDKKRNPFSIKESFIFGWEAFKAHYRVFVPAMGISVAISFASEYVFNQHAPSLTIVGVVFTLGTIAQLIIGMGLTKVALKITAGEPVAFDDVFSVTHLFFSYIGALILYALIVLGGFLLLIVPGLIWLVSYWFFPYALIDGERGAKAAFAEAKRISKGVRGHLFLLILVSGILNIAGVLAYFVGLFITIPVTVLAAAHVYRILQKRLEPELVMSEPNKVLETASQPLSTKPSPIHPEKQVS